MTSKLRWCHLLHSRVVLGAMIEFLIDLRLAVVKSLLFEINDFYVMIKIKKICLGMEKSYENSNPRH